MEHWLHLFTYSRFFIYLMKNRDNFLNLRNQCSIIMNLRAHRKMILVVSFLVAFISVILVIVAGAMYYVQNGTSNWQGTQAEIVSNDYMQRIIQQSISHSQTEYSLNIVYQYVVNGNQVQCLNGQYYGKGHKGINSQSAAESEQSKYPIGKTLTVYYNPNDPSTCSLSRGVTLGTKIFLGVSIGLFVASFTTYKWAKNYLEPLEENEPISEPIIEENPNLEYFKKVEDT